MEAIQIKEQEKIRHSIRHWIWKVPALGGSEDIVELKLGLFGKESLLVNGAVIESKINLRLKSFYLFKISNNKSCEISVSAEIGMPVVVLKVIGEQIRPIQGYLAEEIKNAPKWFKYIFAIFIGSVVITGGGAVPALVAVGGYQLCKFFIQDPKLSHFEKALITAVIWVFTVLMMIGVSLALRRIFYGV